MHYTALSALLMRHHTNARIQDLLRRVNEETLIGTVSYSDPATGERTYVQYTPTESGRKVGQKTRLSGGQVAKWMNVVEKWESGHQTPKSLQEKSTFFSVNVFSKKVLIGYTIFTSPSRDGTSISTGSSKPREGAAVCSAKAVPSFLSYLKNLRIGPALQSSVLPTELILPRSKMSSRLVMVKVDPTHRNSEPGWSGKYNEGHEKRRKRIMHPNIPPAKHGTRND